MYTTHQLIDYFAIIDFINNIVTMAVTLASLQAQFALVETQMALYKSMLQQYAATVDGSSCIVVEAQPASKAKKATAEVTDKPKRQMSDSTRLALKAAQAFNDMLVERDSQAFASYSEAQKALPKEERDGINLKACFAKKYKEAHKDEYEAFISQYKESHSDLASDDEVSAPATVATPEPVVTPAPAPVATPQPVLTPAPVPAVNAAPAPSKPKLKIKPKAKTDSKPTSSQEFVSIQRMTHNGHEVIVDAMGNMYKDEGDMGPGEFIGVYNRSTGVLDTKAKEIV